MSSSVVNLDPGYDPVLLFFSEAARNLRYDDHVTETSEDDAKDLRRNGKGNSSKPRRESSAPASLNSTHNDVEMSDDDEASALNSSQIRRSSRISTKKEIARARETSDAQTEDSSDENSESSEESDVEVEKKKSSSSSKPKPPIHSKFDKQTGM